jgi:hypothetical protein
MSMPPPWPWLLSLFEVLFFVFPPLMLPSLYHYNKSWFFKRLNLIKMFALTKKMYVLTKSMGHERHMVLLVGFMTKVIILFKCYILHLIKKYFFIKMVHQNAHGLIKSAILNGHV